jgi:tetratricopeptide (TPR) repeat protein
LTIAAARCQPRSKKEVEAEAKALICGVSWALQRMRRLPEALAIAQESLELGESIDYARNTAFCKKCLGRMYRLEAEESHDLARRRQLLDQSAKVLREAIDCFTKLLGAENPEVGDCYSLLGRTILLGGDYREAQAEANKAYRLLANHDDKDYLDLCILLGDLASRQKEFELAERYYGEVLSKRLPEENAEECEIFTRSFFSRGVCRSVAGQKSMASADFHEALRIWTALDDAFLASQAEWALIRSSGELDEAALNILGSEIFPVRVMAYELHQLKLASSASGGLSRRSEADVIYWNQVVREAREEVAISGHHR